MDLNGVQTRQQCAWVDLCSVVVPNGDLWIHPSLHVSFNGPKLGIVTLGDGRQFKGHGIGLNDGCLLTLGVAAILAQHQGLNGVLIRWQPIKEDGGGAVHRGAHHST